MSVGVRLGDGDAVDAEAMEFEVDELLVRIGFWSCEWKQTSCPSKRPAAPSQ